MLHVQPKFCLLAFALAACITGVVQAEHFRLHGNNVPVCRNYQYGQPDLFYNFYAPTNCGGIAAGIYPAPLPVPPHVGHTYYTYQPLMPHEFLYRHHRSYHRYYNEGRGLTRTSVIWW